jgi:succinate dehydrogenase flavin-adding protein (antitoxin of CptAB toxin-antitoxin module)
MTSTLETAERAVTKLSAEELAQFRQWFAEYDGELWDAQIEADAAAGKLDALALEALEEYHAGKATEI